MCGDDRRGNRCEFTASQIEGSIPPGFVSRVDENISKILHLSPICPPLSRFQTIKC